MTLPNGVDTIGAYAFFGCSGLTSVSFVEGVVFVGRSAFSLCYPGTVTSFAQVPPVCDSVFSQYETLYVPRGCKATYKAAPEWSRFKIIKELGADDETYTITLRVNDESMGRVTGGGDYAYGTSATLEAVANEGYHFVQWHDGNTDNPRMLTVTEDIELTAIFAKDETAPDDPTDPDDPSNPTDPDDPTANEQSVSAAPFAYVQGRTVYLSDNLGEVEAFTTTGQRVYRGFDRAIALPHPGVYILRVVADGRWCKVAVR